MPITHFLAELIGLYCIIMGAVMLFRKKVFLAVGDGLYKNEEALFLPGLLATLLGLVLVLLHNFWGTSVLAIVITLIGWAALLKGLWLLFFPDSAVHLIPMLKVKEYAWLYGIVIIVIGAYLTYAGFIG